MRIDDIEPGVEFENLNIEFKLTISDSPFENWLKTVAGFANSDGGIMYIGVNDEDTTLKGFSHIYADKIRTIFNNKVNEHLFPKPTCNIEFIKYLDNERELYILKVSILKNKIRPVVMTIKGVPSIYTRRDGFTNGATYDEIINMSILSKNVQYDSLEADKIYKRENFTKLLEFYKEHHPESPEKELTDKALLSIGFFDNDMKLKNGAVLFEDNYCDHETDMHCSVFSGFTRGEEKIVALNRFEGKGNLIDAIRYALDFVNQRMNHGVLKTDTGHIDVPAFPQRALLEGIINAIAHRNYFLTGTQIQIDMFKDRLEISSPGGFYESDIIPKTFNLSSIMSIRRNKLICDVLVKCNVMEAAGTGFDKIIEDYRDADSKHQPYVFSTSSQFTLVLPDLTYEPGLEVDLSNTLVFVPVENGSDYDKKILGFCYSASKSVAQIAEHLNKANSTYLRKVLNNLVKQDYLITSQVGRAKYYKTNHSIVRLG